MSHRSQFDRRTVISRKHKIPHVTGGEYSRVDAASVLVCGAGASPCSAGFTRESGRLPLCRCARFPDGPGCDGVRQSEAAAVLATGIHPDPGCRRRADGYALGPRRPYDAGTGTGTGGQGRRSVIAGLDLFAAWIYGHSEFVGNQDVCPDRSRTFGTLHPGPEDVHALRILY